MRRSFPPRRHATPREAALLALLGAVAVPHLLVSQVTDPSVGTVDGVVFDSTAGRPLPAADVYLWGTTHRARTAEDGSFLIADVPPGRYAMVFYHPRLAELGISPGETTVDLGAGEEESVALAVPSRYTLLAAHCALDEPEVAALGDAVPVVGRVTDAATGVPFPATRVTLSWPGDGSVPSGEIDVRTDETGWFRVCSVPSGVTVGAIGRFGGRSSLRQEVTLEAGRPAHLDLRLGELRPAVLTGRLVDDATGSAVRGAEIALRGTDLRATSGGNGTFRVEDIPPGTYTIVLDHRPYLPREATVVLAAGATSDVILRVSEEPVALPPLEVTVEGTTLTDRAMGGMVVGRADIEQLEARVRDLADVLREQNVSGLLVRRGDPDPCVGFNSGQVRMTGRSSCVPVTVFIDGVRAVDPYAIFTIPAAAIDRMILYRPIEAGNLFGSGSANGVLEVYTRW